MANHKANHLNETNIMSNGQEATIVNYNGTNDIDIQFEDGTIVRHKTYALFKNGHIVNPNKKRPLGEDKIGQTKKMSNGQMATIIKYTSCSDIDVQFEDGTIVTHKIYNAFVSGHIRNPNAPKESILKKDRLGEERTMKSGLKAKIIRSNGAFDVDIQFEDGVIVKHQRYHLFKEGIILHPNDKNDAKKERRLGETRIMNSGDKVTIVAYRKSNDIDVKFEDGTIYEHKTYQAFKHGLIREYSISKELKSKRIGETLRMDNGHDATIIDYKNTLDIKLQFDDGTIVDHKTYGNFKKRKISKDLDRKPRERNF